MFQSKGPYYHILKADFAIVFIPETMIVSFVSCGHSGVTSYRKLSMFSFERADWSSARMRAFVEFNGMPQLAFCCVRGSLIMPAHM